MGSRTTTVWTPSPASWVLMSSRACTSGVWSSTIRRIARPSVRSARSDHSAFVMAELCPPIGTAVIVLGNDGGMELTVVQGDITAQDVDAVVNAASRAMRGGGGVDGAIHRAGGPTVLEDCRRRFPHGLPTGQAGWTTAGAMTARWVVHVVGPNFTAGERDRSLLTSCYSGALQVADELGARTVAFPLVSAGVYGWPLEDAVDAAVDTLRDTVTAVEEARLVAFSPRVFDLI